MYQKYLIVERKKTHIKKNFIESVFVNVAKQALTLLVCFDLLEISAFSKNPLFLSHRWFPAWGND